jgi:hypothetical protein
MTTGLKPGVTESPVEFKATFSFSPGFSRVVGARSTWKTLSTVSISAQPNVPKDSL